jgi:Niemann-Pick C1 protein
MRGLRFTPILTCLGLLSFLPHTHVFAEGETEVHEEGRCAIRGHCGKKSFFGGELPCPDNGPARDPEVPVRKKLVDLCGSKWNEGAVCCEKEQVRVKASSNLFN